ncbi:MAG: cytochrome c [Pirellulales bacterium]|nr:cytochrome c [Pirellulales bacterium]
MSHKFVSAISLLSFLTACGLPYEQDIAEVGERYSFRYNGECSSWLYSAQTGFMYCASPAIDLPTGDGGGSGYDGMEDGPTDLASLSERGEVIYNQVCKTCHQADGAGTPGAFPPLAGSGEYYGDAQNHARIIIHGLSGPIVVQGQDYNGVMTPHDYLTDYDVAAVATYERNSWGNADGIVLPSDAAAAR